jgi:hypothetical protein
MAIFRARGIASLVGAAAVLLAGCTSSRENPASPSRSGSTATSSAQPSAWHRVLAEIGPDGEVSTATALRAFALAFGPLPGVVVPAGEVGTIRSGSGAVRWLANHWDDISDDQRATAIRLVPELAPPTLAPSSGSSFASLTAAAPRHPPSYYVRIAKAMAADITAALGGSPVLGLTLDVAEGAVVQTTSAAETIVVNAAGLRSGTAARCVIRVSQKGAAQDDDIVLNMLTHEVWHCFEGQVLGVDAYDARPAWSMEGEAEWVGNTLSPTTDRDAEWDEYVLDPGAGLFSRSYDAMGFFAHLDEAGLDTWQRLIPVLTQGGDNAAAFEAAGASSEKFLDTWASGWFRQPSYGTAWDMTGPGLAPGQPADVPLMLDVGDGDVVKFDAQQYATSISVLSSAADVLVFAVDGHVRVGDPGTKQEYVLHGASTFCTKSGGCECPPGTAFAGPPPTRLSADSVLAASSGPAATTGTVTGMSLAEFCKSPGTGATWHFDAPSRYSGGPSHTVVDAYTCSGVQGPWHATLHVTHAPATPSDPPLDRQVRFSWTFDRNGRATPTVGPYQDTVFGRTHTIIYYPAVQLDKAARTITVTGLEGSEDGSPRIDVTYQLDRVGEAVPMTAEKSPKC